jgi:hypothetical protein
VVDNVFLAIVGQQVDKIQGFHTSPFRTMRDYVNIGLVYAVLGMLPLMGAVGAAFGAVGAATHKLLRGSATASR